MKYRRFSAYLQTMATFLFVGTATLLPAQDLSDYLRFSETNPTGTARSVAMGGASTSLGADFGSAATNPAGLAMFRRSELSFTPTLRVANSTADFIGTTSDASRTNLGFGQLGIVIAKPIFRARDIGSQNSNGIKSFSIGIGFNQKNNFWRQRSGSAFNKFNTIGDALSGIASGGAPDTSAFVPNDRGAWVKSAYEAYVINPVTNTLAPSPGRIGNYFVPLAEFAQMQQTFTTLERGRTNEWTIAGAVNISDRFFIGLGIGITDHYYRFETTYSEEDVNNVYVGQSNPWIPSSIRRLDFTDVQTIIGAGINARLGLLWQPLDFVRLGASIATPTYSSLNLEYGPEFYTLDHAGTTRPDFGNLQAGSFPFTLTTPWRANAGLTFILGKKGLLTGDVEYVDYSSGSIDFSDASSSEFSRQMTTEIGQAFTSAINYRFGGEFRPTSKFFARAGYAFNATPLNSGLTGPTQQGIFTYRKSYGALETYDQASGLYQVRDIDRSRTSISGGLGYRTSRWSVDLTVVQLTQRDVELVHPIYVTPGSLGQLSDSGVFSTVSFTDGTDDGGLGAGIEPYVVTKTVVLSFLLSLGFTIGK